LRRLISAQLGDRGLVGPPQPLEREVGESVLLTKELLPQVGGDRVLPHQVDPSGREVRSHEVARPDADVSVAEPLICAIDDVCDPDELWLVLLEPATKEALDWRLIGEEGDEEEPP